MPLALDDDEMAAFPALVKLPGGDDRAADVPATMNEVAGNSVELVNTRNDFLPFSQESVVGPIVGDQQRERHALALVVEHGARLPVRVQGNVRGLPALPGQGGGPGVVAVHTGQPAGVGIHYTFARVCLGGMCEVLPGFGEDASDAVGDPPHLIAACRCDRHQSDAKYAIRVPERVGESERAAPRDAGDNPLLDSEVPAHRFDVVEQGLRGVLGQAAEVVLDCRKAFSAPALVQTYGPKPGRVVSLPVAPFAKGAAWASVQVQDRPTFGIPCAFPVDLRVGYVHPAVSCLRTLIDHPLNDMGTLALVTVGRPSQRTLNDAGPRRQLRRIMGRGTEGKRGRLA